MAGHHRRGSGRGSRRARSDFEGQRRDRVRVFLGAALTDAEADDWFGRHIVHYEAAWALFPDTVPALDVLADSYRHAVLSNSASPTRTASCATSASGTASRPAVRGRAGRLQARGRGLPRRLRRAGLPPQEVAYVGDQPEIDGRGAAEAGLLLGLDGPGRRPAPRGPEGPAPDRRPRRAARDPRRPIPVLERRPPSGNVLPAPPGSGPKGPEPEAQAEQDPAGD